MHRHVRDLVDHLGEGDLLVVNDSRVIPARLRLLRDTGGQAEVLLLEPLGADRREWEALVRPGAKVKPGAVLLDAVGDPVVEMLGRSPAGDTFHVRILGEDDPLATLERHGEMPLPPYITAPLTDRDRYQTVYADRPGSAAAPTAGLHLTPSLLDALTAQGVGMARGWKLVVGLDTFQPISTVDPLDHRIHSERYAVPADVLERCGEARRVVAVGTTAVRALESAATFGRLEGRNRALHPPWLRLEGRRPADDQLPHAAHDAAPDDRGLRRPPVAAAVRGRVGGAVPLPVLRRRHAARSPCRGRSLMRPVTFEVEATDGAARAGTATTARGSYTTPCFMPVGTRGAIKYLSAADYERLGAQIVLGNTYHLMLRPEPRRWPGSADSVHSPVGAG